MYQCFEDHEVAPLVAEEQVHTWKVRVQQDRQHQPPQQAWRDAEQRQVQWTVGAEKEEGLILSTKRGVVQSYCKHFGIF